MKLQVNNSGAWKQLICFSVEHVELVKSNAAELGLCAAFVEHPVTFRILDGQETAVLSWSHAAGWHVPRWAEGYTWVP